VDLDRAPVPAEPRLDGHRELDRIDHRLDDPLHLGEITKEPRARVARHDVLHPAAAVDIDEVWSGGLGDPRSLTHHALVTTEDLDRDRALVFVDEKLLVGAAGIADQAFARDKFRHDDIGAELLADPAERWVGDILHRGEDQLMLYVYISNFHHRGDNGERGVEIGKPGNGTRIYTDWADFRGSVEAQSSRVAVVCYSNS
jgi:hypothetical protein